MDEDTNKLMTVATFNVSHLAHLLKANLENEGIEAFVQDEHMIGLNWFYSNALGGIKVQVRKCDLEKAQEILKQQNADDTLDE